MVLTNKISMLVLFFILSATQLFSAEASCADIITVNLPTGYSWLIRNTENGHKVSFGNGPAAYISRNMTRARDLSLVLLQEGKEVAVCNDLTNFQTAEKWEIGAEQESESNGRPIHTLRRVSSSASGEGEPHPVRKSVEGLNHRRVASMTQVGLGAARDLLGAFQEFQQVQAEGGDSMDALFAAGEVGLGGRQFKRRPVRPKINICGCCDLDPTSCCNVQ